MGSSDISRFLKTDRQFCFENVGGMSGEIVPINARGSHMNCHCSFVTSNNLCSPVKKFSFLRYELYE